MEGLACAVGAGALTAMVAPAGASWTVVTATALGFAAKTDWSERRVPIWSIRAGTTTAALSLVLGCWSRWEWLPLARSGIAAALVLVGFGWLWWVRPDALGLGDVKAMSLAAASAAAVSWQAVSTVTFATALAAIGVVGWFAVVRRHGDRGPEFTARRWKATVPFVPSLCVGFVAGVGAS